MYITMQGNWSVTVKSKESSPPMRFIISSATSGNGTHNTVVGSTVKVTGNLWTISVQHDHGTGFSPSYARIKFPVLSGGNYSFDIESNDDKNDQIFDDLILTCSTPNTGNEYLMYGNVSCYSGLCYFNPCYPGWLVIETAAALEQALKNPVLAGIIKNLYPERVPPVIVDPNPPDPGPFKPVIINMASTSSQLEEL